jgi:hypothetical protein
MRLRKAQPNVPYPDRRQRKRIVTLRNFRNFALIAIALFAVISIASEMRGPAKEDFGRLYGREVAKVPETTPEPIQSAIVPAEPVDDNASADPFLLEAAAREQYLGVNEPLQPVVTPAPVEAPAPLPKEHARIEISGDANGVAIVQKDNVNAPVLGGGFMRGQ